MEFTTATNPKLRTSLLKTRLNLLVARHPLNRGFKSPPTFPTSLDFDSSQLQVEFQKARAVQTEILGFLQRIRLQDEEYKGATSTTMY